jgi:hypothetical protein
MVWNEFLPWLLFCGARNMSYFVKLGRDSNQAESVVEQHFVHHFSRCPNMWNDLWYGHIDGIGSYLWIMLFFLSFFAIPNHVPLVFFIFPSVYKFYTSVLFHGCLLHVLFNMLALVSLGTELERIMGSVRLLFLMFLLVTTNAILPNLGWQEAITLIFLHISELWQWVFCRFVSFLVRMLTLYFLVDNGNFYCSFSIPISSPCQQGCLCTWLKIFICFFIFEA